MAEDLIPLCVFQREGCKADLVRRRLASRGWQDDSVDTRVGRNTGRRDRLMSVSFQVAAIAAAYGEGCKTVPATTAPGESLRGPGYGRERPYGRGDPCALATRTSCWLPRSAGPSAVRRWGRPGLLVVSSQAVRFFQSSPAANGFIMAASVAVPGCFPRDIVEAWYWAMNHV